MEADKVNIYLAGPLFTCAQRRFNTELKNQFIGTSVNIVLPQEECKTLTEPNGIMHKCTDLLKQCDAMFVNLDGPEMDSGTAFECGYVVGSDSRIPMIGFRTDYREAGDNVYTPCNLMIGTWLWNEVVKDVSHIRDLSLDLKRVLVTVSYSRLSYKINTMCQQLKKDFENASGEIDPTISHGFLGENFPC